MSLISMEFLLFVIAAVTGYSQHTKVQNKRSRQYLFFPLLFLLLILHGLGGLFHPPAGKISGYCGKEQKTGDADSPADIVNITERQQPHPLKSPGNQVISCHRRNHKQ